VQCPAARRQYHRQVLRGTDDLDLPRLSVLHLRLSTDSRHAIRRSVTWRAILARANFKRLDGDEIVGLLNALGVALSSGFGVDSNTMTDAELEVERVAILVEERELEAAHERLHQRPNDRPGHQAHRERLKAHTARVRAFQAALKHGSDA
jgi:hypothetical protein